MKLPILFGCFLFLLAGTRLAAQGDQGGSDSTGRLVRQWPLSSGQTLSFNLPTGGSVHITGWEQALVRVEADLRGEDWPDLRLDGTATATGLQLLSRYGGTEGSGEIRPTFRLFVPRRLQLQLQTLRGDLRLDNLEGELVGSTVTGTLQLSHLKGQVQLSTQQGDVTVSDSELNGWVSTAAGEVQLREVTGLLQADAPQQAVSVDQQGYDAAGGARVVQLHLPEGDVEVESAALGADIYTMQGDIRLGSAQQQVRATTLGGNIVIESAAGSVEATTYQGNLEVTLTGDAANRQITLSAREGDVTLTLPANCSAQVSVGVFRSAGNTTDYQIQSALGLSSTALAVGTGESLYRQASRVLAEGRSTIYLRVTNGNVYLKQSSSP